MEGPLTDIREKMETGTPNSKEKKEVGGVV
jgi:hypothetical protein